MCHHFLIGVFVLFLKSWHLILRSLKMLTKKWICVHEQNLTHLKNEVKHIAQIFLRVWRWDNPVFASSITILLPFRAGCFRWNHSLLSMGRAPRHPCIIRPEQKISIYWTNLWGEPEDHQRLVGKQALQPFLAKKHPPLFFKKKIQNKVNFIF